MTAAASLPCVSQMQPADTSMELGSRDSGYRKDLELSFYFDAVSVAKQMKNSVMLAS